MVLLQGVVQSCRFEAWVGPQHPENDRDKLRGFELVKPVAVLCDVLWCFLIENVSGCPKKPVCFFFFLRFQLSVEGFLIFEMSGVIIFVDFKKHVGPERVQARP